MSKRTRDTIVAVVALGAAALAVYLAFGRTAPELELDTYEVLGAVTAEETAKLLNGNGRVLVMVRDTGPDKNPSVEAELKAFQQAMKQHSGVSVAIDKIQVTPMLMMSTGGGVPPDQLFKALQTHANPDAVVLFFGFPQLTDLQLEALKQTGVKTVVVSSFRPAYQRLLERKAIQLAIVPRPESPALTPGKTQTVRERFDQEYIVMRAANPVEQP
ncbi:MAG: sugar ABC transporter substrate-binding protein [Verrucomicrobia bacterium]|nr:sugar ABC transporter substrate-binding protein [Verrucomicrobiota bacterium]